MITVPSAIAALNLTIAIVLTMVVVEAVRCYRGRKLSWGGRMMTIGFIISFTGWVLQRMFWAVGRMLESSGEFYLHTEVYKSYSWVTILPLFMVVFGAGFFLAAMFESKVGPSWFAWYSGLTLSIWGLLAWIL